MQERSQVNVAMSHEQLMKLRRIAKARDQTVSQVIRKWVDRSKLK
jgi:flagellar biosynthesis/type III secretory pathway M-ring protein FliF/YscJ